jgi:hypothetical protein
MCQLCASLIRCLQTGQYRSLERAANKGLRILVQPENKLSFVRTSVKIALNILFATFATSTIAAPLSVHEGSWHAEEPTFEVAVQSGEQEPSGSSSLDITITTSGNVICGIYDGTIAMRRPKTSFFDFIGYQADGAMHVYFPNGFTGDMDDIGEANIARQGKRLKWTLTREPRGEDYLFTDEYLSAAEFDVKRGDRLRKNCTAIAHDFGEINNANAHDAVSRLNSH